MSTDYEEEDQEEDDEDEDAENENEDDKNRKVKSKESDLPKPGEQLGDEWCSRVSDMGFPVSEEGVELAQNLDKERDKRNQDFHDTYIYNDCNGYGTSEAVQNFVSLAWHMEIYSGW